MTKLSADEVWDDYVTPSVPASGEKKPQKPEIRDLINAIDAIAGVRPEGAADPDLGVTAAVLAAISNAGPGGLVGLLSTFAVSSLFTNFLPEWTGPGSVTALDPRGSGEPFRLDRRGLDKQYAKRLDDNVAVRDAFYTNSPCYGLLLGDSRTSNSESWLPNPRDWPKNIVRSHASFQRRLPKVKVESIGVGGSTLQQWARAEALPPGQVPYLEQFLGIKADGSLVNAYDFFTGLSSAPPILNTNLRFIGIQIGINDVNRGYSQAIADAWQLVNLIRMHRGVDTLTIVITTPLMTDDPWRHETWCERLVPGFEKVAQDHACQFLDFYNRFSARRGKGGVDMDSVTISGNGPYGVHATGALNQQIWTWFADCLFDGVGLYSAAPVALLPSSDETAAMATLPKSYAPGIYLLRTSAAWVEGAMSIDGFVLILVASDGGAFQLVFDYAGGASLAAYRVGRVDGVNNSWGPLIPLRSIRAAITPGSGFSAVGGFEAVLDGDGGFSVKGYEALASAAAISTSAGALGTSPVNFRPAAATDVVLAFSGGSSGDVLGKGRFATNGQITCLTSGINAQNVSIIGRCFV